VNKAAFRPRINHPAIASTPASWTSGAVPTFSRSSARCSAGSRVTTPARRESPHPLHRRGLGVRLPAAGRGPLTAEAQGRSQGEVPKPTNSAPRDSGASGRVGGLCDASGSSPARDVVAPFGPIRAIDALLRPAPVVVARGLQERWLPCAGAKYRQTASGGARQQRPEGLSDVKHQLAEDERP
jgi:hypothetical protein